MPRWWILPVVLIVGAVAVVVAMLGWGTLASPPIVVGIIHSQSGPWAVTEKPLIDAEVLALEEINEQGGLLGRKLTWVIADGRSSDAAFAEQAQRLITVDQVRVLFGGLTSGSRKSMKSVVEESKHLLFYPASYEGFEQSDHIVYTGGPANQQVTPAVSWCLKVLKPKKIHVVVTDSIWGRSVGALVHDALKALGAPEATEHTLLPGTTDVAAIVKAVSNDAPAVVFGALDAETSAVLFARLAQAGLSAEQVPVVSFNLTEDDLRTLPIKDVAGHYAAWNYFQSIDRPENQAFVAAYKARFGQDRVTCDSIASAYNSVRIWAQAVREADTDAPGDVLQTVRRQSLDGPEGVVSVDSENLNNWRPFFIGKVRNDAQFDIVFEVHKPVPPVLYPRTRSKSEWERFVADLSAGWGGRWANPSRETALAAPR